MKMLKNINTATHISVFSRLGFPSKSFQFNINHEIMQAVIPKIAVEAPTAKLKGDARAVSKTPPIPDKK